MEKELNLIEILKGAPRGTKLYSPIFGECELEKVSEETELIFIAGMGREVSLFKEGTFFYKHGECVLFPSRDNRDWSTFKIEKEDLKVGDHIKRKDSDNVFKIKEQDNYLVTLTTILADSPEIERTISAEILDRYEKVEKFDPKWLKPFDRVLVRDNTTDLWFASLFSYSINEDEEEYPYTMCDGNPYNYCIPFNEETKSLVGTSNEEPEFYRI